MKPAQRFPHSAHDDKPVLEHAPPDFLGQLQESWGVDELAAAEKLQAWLAAYEPGPAALARAGTKRTWDETVAA